MNRVAIVAGAFFCVQRYEGTPLYFAVGCLLFVLISALAFNISGGLTRISGAYIFFYSLLVVIIGIGYKAFLGERADSNLSDPHTTIEAYVGSISVMFLAAFLSRRFRRKTGLLQNTLKLEDMYRASVGCIACGIVLPIGLSLLGPGAHQLALTFSQLNQLMPLGILIGVMYEIRRSGGRRSINLPILATAAISVFYGIIDFSKQGLLFAPFCWFLPVWALGYRLTRAQIAGGLVALFILFHYLVPFAQYGRSLVNDEDGLAERTALAMRLLEDPAGTRKAYIGSEETAPRGLNSYYNTPQGFWERLQFISADDALINVTDEGRVFGLAPLSASLANAVPHFIWPDKPLINLGNLYAHEIGGLSDEDTSTGISFSATAEAYHMARWNGVLLVAPMIWMILFVSYDSLFGELRASPWGLLVTASVAHYAPEGALSGIIHLLTFGTEIAVFCALFAKWVAPVIANLVLGPDRSRGTALSPLRSRA